MFGSYAALLFNNEGRWEGLSVPYNKQFFDTIFAKLCKLPELFFVSEWTPPIYNHETDSKQGGRLPLRLITSTLQKERGN